MNRSVTLVDSFNSEKSIEVDRDDAGALLDAVFCEFGYDALEDYLKNYDPNNCVIVVYTKNPKNVIIEAK